MEYWRQAFIFLAVFKLTDSFTRNMRVKINVCLDSNLLCKTKQVADTIMLVKSSCTMQAEEKDF